MNHEFSGAEVYEISAYRQRLGHNILNGATSPEEPPQPGAGQPVAAVEGGAVKLDYSSQLAFHQQELSEAEARGFPPGQTAYHAGKVAVLEALMNNVVFLKDYRGRRT